MIIEATTFKSVVQITWVVGRRAQIEVWSLRPNTGAPAVTTITMDPIPWPAQHADLEEAARYLKSRSVEPHVAYELLQTLAGIDRATAADQLAEGLPEGFRNRTQVQHAIRAYFDTPYIEAAFDATYNGSSFEDFTAALDAAA